MKPATNGRLTATVIIAIIGFVSGWGFAAGILHGRIGACEERIGAVECDINEVELDIKEIKRLLYQIDGKLKGSK